jgi:phasin family protein
MQSFSDNPALRAHLESQIDSIHEFNLKMFDMLREMSEMNLRLARQIIEGSLHVSREMLGATAPAQFAQVAMKQVEPATERWRAYQQHMMSAFAGVQADLAQAAQAKMPEASRSASAAAEEMVRRASSAVNIPVSGGNGSATDKHH